jgi:polysaccharide biosynthesis/export protein
VKVMMLWTARTWRFCRTHGRTLLVLLLPVIVAQPTPAAGGQSDYLVGPNDVLVITVFDQPQLSGKYLVQADGSVTFPLLGRLKAGGMSMQAVEDDLRGRLISGGILTKPQVAVTIDQYRSQQVFVMGEVRQPGSLQFTGTMDVIEALARAGAVTDRADTEALIVRSPNGAPAAPASAPRDAAAVERARSDGSAEIIKIDLQELQSGALTQNVRLRPGDTIFVPRAKSVFVSGQVRTAGEYVIRRGMTVRQVIALAGGVTDRGSTKRIQVVRRTEDKEVTLSIQLQDLVQPGDTIVVRDRFF